MSSNVVLSSSQDKGVLSQRRGHDSTMSSFYVILTYLTSVSFLLQRAIDDVEDVHHWRPGDMRCVSVLRSDFIS